MLTADSTPTTGPEKIMASPTPTREITAGSMLKAIKAVMETVKVDAKAAWQAVNTTTVPWVVANAMKEPWVETNGAKAAETAWVAVASTAVVVALANAEAVVASVVAAADAVDNQRSCRLRASHAE